MSIEKSINKHHASLSAINTPESLELAQLFLKTITEEDLSKLVTKSKVIHIKAFEPYIPALNEIMGYIERIKRACPDDPFTNSFIFDTILNSIEDAKNGYFFYGPNVTPSTLIGALKEQLMEYVDSKEKDKPTADTAGENPKAIETTTPENKEKETDMKETQPPYMELLQLLTGQIVPEELKAMDRWSHVLNAKGPIPNDDQKDIGIMPVSTTSSMISNKHEEAQQQQQEVQHDRKQWLTEQLQKSTPVDRDYFNTWTGAIPITPSELGTFIFNNIVKRQEAKAEKIQEQPRASTSCEAGSFFMGILNDVQKVRDERLQEYLFPRGLRKHCVLMHSLHKRYNVFNSLLRELSELDNEQGRIFFNKMQALVDASPLSSDLVKKMDSIITEIQLKLKAIAEFAKPYGSSGIPGLPIQLAEGDKGDKEAEIKDRIFKKLKQLYSIHARHNVLRLTAEELELLLK